MRQPLRARRADFLERADASEVAATRCCSVWPATRSKSAATAIGITPDELRRAIDDGRTISSVAADAGVPTGRVVDAVVRDATAKVDRGVAAGNVAADRARTLQGRLPLWAERFVLNTPAMLAGTQPVPAPISSAVGNG